MFTKLTRLIILAFFSIIFMNYSYAQAPVITHQPHSQGVIQGEKATFSVLASGTALTYQWYLNNTPIGGATDSIYTTPSTTMAFNGDQYQVVVSNGSGADTSNVVILYVTATGSRVTDNQVVLYNFHEGKGNTINDVSGVAYPLNLTINNPSDVDWSPYGLLIKNGAMINSTVSATQKLVDSVRFNNEMTIEMWIRPLSNTYSRIMDLTQNSTNVDFGVESLTPPRGYNFVVRTSTTNNEGIPGADDTLSIKEDLTQLVLTHSSDGISKIYRNGVEVASDSIGGNVYNWIYNVQLSLGSFLDGTNPWNGIIYLTSFYDRALDSVEVAHNFSLGVDGGNAPFILGQPSNSSVLAGYSTTFNVNAVGNKPFSYQWQKNDADISGATDSVYTIPSASIADSGAAYRVIVTNASGSDTSNNAILTVKSVNSDCANGIIHYYHLDEPAPPYKDIEGFTNATSSAPPTAITGIVDTAQNFTGAQKIDIPYDNTFDWKANESFSLEFWMKTNVTPSGTEVMIGRSDNSTGLQWYVGYSSNGKVAFFLKNTNNEFNTVGNAGPNVNDNKWHLIAAVRNGTSNKLYLYVDGTAVDSTLQTYSAGFSGSTGVNLGYLNIAPYYYYQGSLDEVAIYDAVLSQSDILKHYNKGIKGFDYCAIPPTITAPSNLKAVYSPDTNKVTLTWKDNSSNESGFVIERKNGDSTSTSNFITIDTVAQNTTSYADSNVSQVSGYTYRIYAYGLDTVSTFSNLAEVTTTFTPINKPSNLVATPKMPDSVHVMLTWKDNSSNEDGFVIERRIGDTLSTGNFTTVDTVGANTTTYADTNTAQNTTYTYRIYAYNQYTTSDFSDTAQIMTPTITGITKVAPIPKEFSLGQNYPNPFNPSTRIQFALPVEARVTVTVYNTLGQEVTRLYNSVASAGVHEINFNATRLSSGIYFYRIVANGVNGKQFISTKRMLLLK